MKRERRASQAAAVPHEEWLLEQLKAPEFAAEYLNASLGEGDQAAFMLALRDVARARGGISALAKHSRMNRVALSRALSAKGNPELQSLSRILAASGLRIIVATNARRGRKIHAKRTRHRIPLEARAA